MSFIEITDFFNTFPELSSVHNLVYNGTPSIIFPGSISSVSINFFNPNSTQSYPAVVPDFVLDSPYSSYAINII